MKRTYIDLKSFFNKRHVYPASTEFDILNPYYVEEQFRFGEIESNGVFAYIDRNAEKLDSMNCLKQTVEINDLPCDSIVFIGTCCWGYYKEEFKLKFSDGSTGCAKAVFFDWYWSVEDTIKVAIGLDAEELSEYNHVFRKQIKRDDKKDYCFIYYYKTDFKIKGRKLRQIIFPDNMFMNIFAITVYGEE